MIRRLFRRPPRTSTKTSADRGQRPWSPRLIPRARPLPLPHPNSCRKTSLHLAPRARMARPLHAGRAVLPAAAGIRGRRPAWLSQLRFSRAFRATHPLRCRGVVHEGETTRRDPGSTAARLPGQTSPPTSNPATGCCVAVHEMVHKLAGSARLRHAPLPRACSGNGHRLPQAYTFVEHSSAPAYPLDRSSRAPGIFAVCIEYTSGDPTC